MTLKLARATVATTALLAAGASHAQDWDYAASFYLFMPETDITIGDTTATITFSDALKNLDFAFMGAFQGTNGQWGFIADLMRIDLSDTVETPGPITDGVDVDAKTVAFSGFATYRVYDTGSVKTELLGGFRYFRIDQEITTIPNIGPSVTVGFDEDWIDPVVGVRTFFPINGKWDGTFLADIGGWTDRITYQALLSANYNINENWTLHGGLRYFNVENDENVLDFQYEQFGPLVGATYRF